MSGRGSAWRRRTVGVIANLTLLATATGAVVYAVHARGYDSHRAELNDGGIWVTNSSSGYYGRINKPIGQQDASTFATLGDELDLVQEDAVVVGVEGTGRRLRPLDPATATAAEEAGAPLPRYASVQLAGGSLAVLDAGTGAVRAQRVDPQLAAPQLDAVGTDAGPLATVTTPASLAVTQAGTVLVAAADDTITRLAPAGDGFAAAAQAELDEPVGDALSLTAVGEVPVVLDGDTGTLVAQGRMRAILGDGAVLQVPGPEAGEVLVATTSALVSVDLATGGLTTVYSGASGRPTPPVRLGACVYGAWSGGRGIVVTRCGNDPVRAAFLQGEANDLVFRVNRGQIVLNDRFSGRVWNIDSDQPRTLDDWPAFNQKDNDDSDDKDTKKSADGDRRPPKAEPDTFGARAGRTTTLYPLDNDSAPVGRVLAIRSVEQISRNGAKLTIGPDGQTVQLKLPPGTTAPTSFEYFIDDGREVSAHARVTVSTRRDSANRPPALRDGYQPKTWSVPAGGSMELPVLPEWRDVSDGDSLSLTSAAVTGDAAGARARTTATGRLRFAAPPKPGKVSVRYAVSDGRSEPVPTDLTFVVQDPERDRAVAAVAEPDITSVEAGRWVTLRPLANDLPGSDPLDERAQLQLAGKVAAAGGAQVRTDLSNGTVAFRATAPKTYTLDYDVAYGTAPLAHGKIRVDVRPRERRRPVAMPDSLTLYGTAPGIVDVLANDHDPAGGLLVVQRAWALQEDLVDVAIIDGRWVRVSARQGQLRGPQVVRYAISNGGASVVGEVTVTQRPAPDDNAPVTTDDEVTVRAGAAVTVPVLDNDYSPSGDALSLVADVVGEKAGQLSVLGPDGTSRMTGTATVSGRLVRYVAPAKLTEPATFNLSYYAANTAGDSSRGEVRISVVPASADNNPPEPPVLEARTVAGGTVVIKLPGMGIDPDGDPVSLVGLGSAPQLGRVTKLGANTIEYQAFPDVFGTDEFEYTLTDDGGMEASGTVRVAIAPAGPPQPPLAVPDTITVEPGRLATVTPTANDFVAPGDSPTLELVDPPAGVRLESPTGPVTLEAPVDADGRTVEVVYELSNGLTTSQSTITLRTSTPYNNPPVVFDAYGASNDSVAMKVDVLKSAYDPDGPSEALRVTDVYAPAGVAASVNGGKITITRGDLPLVVPFRVADADGGAAIAQLYVPPRSGNLPFVKANGLIRLAPGDSTRVRLSDYVVSPGGLPLRLAAGADVTGAPSGGVNAVAVSGASIDVTAGKTYEGPGAVTFEVVAGTDQNDADAPRAWLSIPVQVGRNKPILTCPTDVIEVPQGGEVSLDIATLCNVWTPDPDGLADLDYTSSWRKATSGLEIVDPTAMPVVVQASGGVRAGTEAVLRVQAGSSDPGELRVRVVKAPAPALAPINITDLKAGESRTLDLGAYLSSGLPRPVPTVVRVTELSGGDVTVRPAGGATVRVAAGSKAAGEARFRVVMSDVAGDDPDRQAANVLTLEMLGVPDAPKAPVPGLSSLSQSVRLSWQAPAANGAPIDLYELRASNGATTSCPSTTCDMSGLTNGESYTFTVRARNAIGWSDWSPASRPAQPDEKPGPVSNIRQSKTGSHVLTLSWDPPTKKTSKIDLYKVTWQGRVMTTSKTSIVANGLTNGKDYVFTIRAHNAQGWGAAVEGGPFHSEGPIGKPKNLEITEQATSGSTTTLTLTWDAVPANGGAAVTYIVLRNGLPLASCNRISATQCVIPNVRYDGTRYDFQVQPVSGEDGIGPVSSTKTWLAVAKPMDWGAWTLQPTGKNNEAQATFTVPNSRGRESTVQIVVDGNPGEGFAATGTTTRKFSVPSNNRAFGITLKVCNENGQCSSSGQQSVRTYGPLVAGDIVIDRTGSGTNVGWGVTVDPNGADVRVEVRFSGSSRADQTVNLGPDQSQVSIPTLDLGYSATETITVVVSDPPRGRGPVQKQSSFTTADPPPPVVTVKRYTKCNDDPANGRDPCHPAGDGSPDCTDASCGFISITVENFFSPVTCTVSRQGFGPTDEGPWSGQAEHATQLYFGRAGVDISVACRNADNSVRKTQNFTWPS